MRPLNLSGRPFCFALAVTSSKSSPLPKTSSLRGCVTPVSLVLCSSTRRRSSLNPLPHTTLPRK